MAEDPAEGVHEALKGYLDEGEIVVSWIVVIDVAGPDGQRYLAHRAGGGHDGTDPPMAWAALGMVAAAVGIAERQLAAMEGDPDEGQGDET